MPLRKEARSQQTTGLFHCRQSTDESEYPVIDKQKPEKEVVMKILLLALGIRTVIEILRNKKNETNATKVDVVNKMVRYPAEFELR